MFCVRLLDCRNSVVALVASLLTAFVPEQGVARDPRMSVYPPSAIEELEALRDCAGLFDSARTLPVLGGITELSQAAPLAEGLYCSFRFNLLFPSNMRVMGPGGRFVVRFRRTLKNADGSETIRIDQVRVRLRRGWSATARFYLPAQTLSVVSSHHNIAMIQ